MEIVITFLIKFFITMQCAWLIARKTSRFVDEKHMVIGWMTTYLLEIFSMAFLSFFNCLNQTSLLMLWIMIAFMMFGINMFLYQKGDSVIRICISGISKVTFCAVVILALFMVLHSLIFFDATPDAMAYGMPRILFFAQKQSLFMDMHTAATNIMANEWNGEINAIFYLIVTGNIQSVPFANAENYLYGILAIFYCCKRIVGNTGGGYIAVVYMSAPVTIFLALVCKGDFLPIILLPLNCVGAYEILNKNINLENILLVAASGSLCAGSKITMIPCIGLLTILCIIYIFRYSNKIMWGKAFVIFLTSYVFGCLRYILNLIYYQNFFQRVDVENEKLKFSLERFADSFTQLLQDMTSESDNLLTRRTMYALAANGGTLALIIALIAILVIIKNSRHWKEWRVNKSAVIIAVILLFCLCFTLSTTMYLSWSYRYFAPYLGCGFLALVGFAYKLHPPKAPGAAAFIAILSVATGIGLCALPGETNGEGASLAKVLSMKQVEKQMSSHLWLLENPEGAEDIYDFYPMIRHDKKILICNSVDQIHSYLYGENNSNDITYCTVNEVQEKYYDENWDAVMLSTVYDIDKTFLEEGGYICYKPSQIFQEVWVKKSSCLDDS